MALTIDDGPSEYTKEILEVLQANGVRATFFIIGSHVEKYEDACVLRELAEGGNEFANHAMYDEPSHRLPILELKSQIEMVDGMISQVYRRCNRQFPPKYFRPGSGFFNMRMRKLLRDMGYRLVLGNVFPFDPQIPFWRVNAWHILSMLQPGGIIICHDGRAWTVPMLRKVLPEMKREGYSVVTVTELLAMGRS